VTTETTKDINQKNVGFFGGLEPNVPRYTPAPVRYADGVIRLTFEDLRSDGYGFAWGQTRSWSNANAYSRRSYNGTGMVDSETPVLLQTTTGVVINSNSTVAHFFDLNGSSYAPRYFYADTFTFNASTNTFTDTDLQGDQIQFYDYNSSWPALQQGHFKSWTDPYGNSVSVVSFTSAGQIAEVQRSATVGSVTTTESYVYSYLPTSDPNGQELQSIVFRTQVNGGAWTTVRQVNYAYYISTDSSGDVGDLKTAQILDGSGNLLDTDYYRYYRSGDANGYAHRLKYALTAPSYARLAAAVSNPLTATDSQVSTYADYYFQYDTSHRVTEEIAQGQGCSGCGGGLGTFTYAYATSGNTAGPNSWSMKTTETLPDGNQNIVYSNAAAEVMLRVYVDATSGLKWETFGQYDNLGRLLLTASPSAVNGYNDGYADLLHYQSGSGYQYLNNSAGLIRQTVYATITTASTAGAGDVAGYLKQTTVQQGQTGTAIVVSSQQYILHTANGTTVNPVASRILYRNTNGTGPETTTYSYTWFTGTNREQSVVVNAPVIASAQNGPGAADVATTYFDTYGRPIWSKDGDGFITYIAYDPATGAVVKTIEDVDTSKTGDFTNLPSGWTTPTGGGLHLIRQWAVDGLGRPIQYTDPDGNITYTVYNDPNYEMLVYPGWNSSTNLPTGPTQVYREDRPGSYRETLTMTATPHLTNGKPDGSEAISNLQTLSRDYTNAAGQFTIHDAYFNLSGVTYSTALYIGTQNVNFYRKLTDYDSRGRLSRVQRPTGTIERTVYDGLSRIVSTWVGTNDTPGTGQWSPSNNTAPSNMIQLTANIYDNNTLGGATQVGDGNLTQQIVSAGGSAPARVTESYFDWRDRPVASKQGVQASEDTTTHRPIVYVTYDNLDQVVTQQQYDGDSVTMTSSNGVPVAPSASLLRAQTNQVFDDQGRVYQTQVYEVNQSSGAVSNTALTTNLWYNHRGERIATSSPGGLVEKDQYDGAGRQTVTYWTDGSSGSTWTAAGSVTSDNVLRQVDTSFDAAGNTILSTDRERFDNETTTGALGNPTTAPLARVSYVASYYDQANRLTAKADVGTNGGSAYTRPSSVPTASDTNLVTLYTYTAAGWLGTVTDPRGIVEQTTSDALGRTTQTIEDYTDGNPTASSNKTTQFTYDGDDHVLTVKALEPASAYQTTQYVYGVTTAGGSDVNSNDILAATQYPDPTTGNPSSAQQESYTVNELGQVKTFTDRNGNVHTYTFDILGRMTADAITTLGSGVDGGVRRLEIAYDTGGRPYLFTSYDAAVGGNIVNQVQRTFNGFGQLTTEYQSHSGAVNTSSTPSVQYAYAEMAGGVNNSRLVSMTYPNGRVLNYNYATGVDNTISRLTSLSDSSATLESLTYLELNTVVRRSHPQPGVDLTYIKQSGEANGDAGDQYTGLDRFGRVVDQRWIVTATGIATDRFQYGYDRDGNRLYRNNLVNTAFGELYHASGAGNGYDQLNQLTGFARGVLSASQSGGMLDTVTAPTRTQSWSLDALGNWSSVTTNGTAQNRTHNQQNEATVVGGNTLTFDNNGNTTTDDTGKTLVYDAWNRLVKVKSGTTTLASYQFDALGRRIVENSGTLRDLYFSNQWQVLEERINGVANIQYVWSPVYVDALIERDRDPTGGGNMTERVYVQQDANWNVTALVSAAGLALERYVYDPYGAATFLNAGFIPLAGSAFAWIYLHQGGRYDPTTGLFLFRHRDYSPTLGRWLQPDPLTFGGGDADFYRLAADNPCATTDPNGLAPPYVPRNTPFNSHDPDNKWPAEAFRPFVPTRPFDSNPANFISAYEKYGQGCWGISGVRSTWAQRDRPPGAAYFLSFGAAKQYQTTLGGAGQAIILAQQVVYDPKYHDPLIDPLTYGRPKPNRGPGHFDPLAYPNVIQNTYNIANMHQDPGAIWYWEYMNHGYSRPDPMVIHKPFASALHHGLPTVDDVGNPLITFYVVVPFYKPPPIPPGMCGIGR
jgi:RHS repeat-associated protein